MFELLEPNEDDVDGDVAKLLKILQVLGQERSKRAFTLPDILESAEFKRYLESEYIENKDRWN